jgi:hypothetical protein
VEKGQVGKNCRTVAVQIKDAARHGRSQRRLNKEAMKPRMLPSVLGFMASL